MKEVTFLLKKKSRNAFKSSALTDNVDLTQVNNENSSHHQSVPQTKSDKDSFSSSTPPTLPTQNVHQKKKKNLENIQQKAPSIISPDSSTKKHEPRPRKKPPRPSVPPPMFDSETLRIKKPHEVDHRNSAPQSSIMSELEDKISSSHKNDRKKKKSGRKH